MRMKHQEQLALFHNSIKLFSYLRADNFFHRDPEWLGFTGDEINEMMIPGYRKILSRL